MFRSGNSAAVETQDEIRQWCPSNRIGQKCWIWLGGGQPNSCTVPYRCSKGNWEYKISLVITVFFELLHPYLRWVGLFFLCKEIVFSVCLFCLTPATIIVKFEPRPHVSVFVRKRKFFFADCLPIHTYPANKVTDRKQNFLKFFPEWKVLETPFSILGWTDENETSKTPTSWYGMVSCARFKMANGRITSVSLLHGLFSSLIACLEINIA